VSVTTDPNDLPSTVASPPERLPPPVANYDHRDPPTRLPGLFS